MRLHGVIALIVDFEVLITRITARRTCASCGSIFNLAVDTIPDENKCPKCGGELVHRDDDNEVVVRKRIEGYRHETAPLLAHYEKRELLHTVDAMGTPAEVGERIAAILTKIEAAAARKHLPVWSDKENI